MKLLFLIASMAGGILTQQTVDEITASVSPSTTQVMGYDTSTGSMVSCGLQNTFAYKTDLPTNNNQLTNGAGYLTSVPAQSWASITGKPTTLAGWGITDAPTAASLKVPISFSGTTNASGAYTITFGTTYSVPPNVQASIPNQTATNQFIKVSSVSTTGCTINVYQRNTVTLLSVEVLLAATANVSGAPVDVLVTPK
jgi:hypothetical protein